MDNAHSFFTIILNIFAVNDIGGPFLVLEIPENGL
jgi:hypothetical protein